MKRFLIIFGLLLIFASIVSAETVKITNPVNDYADIFTAQEEQQLNQILLTIFNSKIAEYSIVTINSLEGKSIDGYSLELAQGHLGDSEKNNGLLLLIALEEKKYRFEVGRGVEYIINDAKIGRVGRTYMVPYFKEEQYGAGAVQASLAIQAILLGDTNSTYYVDEPVNARFNLRINLVYIIFIFILILIPTIIGGFRSKHRKDKYFDAAAGAIILFGGRRRGGSGGGFSGGSFGGFGGGGFGGGGAGGSW
ncbi:TPM domain-containing protein [Candidatus Woesearchaeota archaeon]|nr:TPM domain-containing protein [Candidatus Woesearchaeota archaeon]